MQNTAEKLIEQKKYSEHLKLIQEIYKKNDSQENAEKLKKAEKMLNSYEEYLKYKSKERKTYYDILDVKEDATLQEIKEKYKKLVLKFHPDRSFIKETNEIFMQIQTAYSTLNDERARKEYDDRLRMGINNDSQNVFNNRNRTVFYTNSFVFDRDFSSFVYEDQFDIYRRIYNMRRNMHRDRQRNISEEEKFKVYFFVIIFIIFYILSSFA